MSARMKMTDEAWKEQARELEPLWRGGPKTEDEFAQVFYGLTMKAAWALDQLARGQLEDFNMRHRGPDAPETLLPLRFSAKDQKALSLAVAGLLMICERATLERNRAYEAEQRVGELLAMVKVLDEPRAPPRPTKRRRRAPPAGA